MPFIEYRIKDLAKLFFLEADRATERISVIIEKLEQYKTAFEAGEWQNQYGVFPTLVFITVSDTRKRSILRALQGYPYKSKVMTLEELTANPSSLVGGVIV